MGMFIEKREAMSGLKLRESEVCVKGFLNKSDH
jgi:hypothetical protein